MLWCCVALCFVVVVSVLCFGVVDVFVYLGCCVVDGVIIKILSFFRLPTLSLRINVIVDFYDRRLPRVHFRGVLVLVTSTLHLFSGATDNFLPFLYQTQLMCVVLCFGVVSCCDVVMCCVVL